MSWWYCYSLEVKEMLDGYVIDCLFSSQRSGLLIGTNHECTCACTWMVCRKRTSPFGSECDN